MKKLFISLVLCLIAEFVMSQTIICNGSNAVFSGDSRPGAYLWTVESPNGAIIFNGSVATIIDGFPLPPLVFLSIVPTMLEFDLMQEVDLE